MLSIYNTLDLIEMIEEVIYIMHNMYCDVSRVISWLKAAFPSSRVIFKARAVRSTDSFFAMSRFQDSLEINQTIDLAIFDSCT